jgi:hypothetical protein
MAPTAAMPNPYRRAIDIAGGHGPPPPLLRAGLLAETLEEPDRLVDRRRDVRLRCTVADPIIHIERSVLSAAAHLRHDAMLERIQGLLNAPLLDLRQYSHDLVGGRMPQARILEHRGAESTA